MGDGLGIPRESRILIAASKPWPGRSLSSAHQFWTALSHHFAPWNTIYIGLSRRSRRQATSKISRHPSYLSSSPPPPPPPSTVALLGSCVKGAPGGTMATAVATKPAETAAYTDAWAALEAQVKALKGTHLRDLLQYVFLLLFLSEP